jgi:hypothetical protein
MKQGGSTVSRRPVLAEAKPSTLDTPSTKIRRPALRAARLASPGLVPPSGFLTLLTVCSPPYPSGFVARSQRRNAETRLIPVTLLGFGSPPELFPETAAVTPLGVRNLLAVGILLTPPSSIVQAADGRPGSEPSLPPPVRARRLPNGTLGFKASHRSPSCQGDRDRPPE